MTRVVLLVAAAGLATLWSPTVAAQDADPTASTLPLEEQRPLPTRLTTPDDGPATNGPASTVAPSSATPSTGPTATAPISKGEGLNNALPRPNSGHEPRYQGDRGTGSQYAVLGAMLLAFAVIITLVVRQSRRSRVRWSATAPMAGTHDPTSSGTPRSNDSQGPASDAPKGS